MTAVSISDRFINCTAVCFFCEDDSQTVDYDPYQNSEIAAYYAEIAAYAGDKDSVEIKFLGDDQVCLFVSEEYLAFAEEKRNHGFY